MSDRKVKAFKVDSIQLSNNSLSREKDYNKRMEL